MAAPQHFFSGGFNGTATAPAVLGRGAVQPPPEALQVLTAIDDVRIAVRRVASSAQRLLSIYTADLEPPVYDEAQFLEIIKRFVLGSNFAKVRVLVHEPLRLIGNTNRFVAMSRRLSSYIEIRTAAPQFAHNRSAMMIADSNAIMFRTQAARWEGVAGFNHQSIARQHLLDFDEMWIASAPET